MTSIHISVDMQLYIVTKQVCWYHPEQLHCVCPPWWDAYYTFIGCIAKLMKGSGLDVHVAAAYGGLTGMSTIYLEYHDVTNTLSLCYRYL